MNLTLSRATQGPLGTFGVLSKEGIPICLTCEDPWNNNETGNSCIPEGTYQCAWHNGPKYQNVWEVRNVPNRSAILIHWGNTPDDTKGCILVGSSYATLNGLPAVINSKATISMLRAMLPKEFTLKIVNPKE